MYRVITIVCVSLVVAACSSTPDWMPSMNLDALKPSPAMETVRFESEPAGAEAKVTSGQACRTPCALALPVDAPVTVNFSLNGYHPQAEKIENVSMGDGTSALRPNPVLVELTPAPPPPKPAAKPRKRTAAPAKKPAAKPATASTASRPAAPAAQAPASSPWPSPTSQQ